MMHGKRRVLGVLLLVGFFGCGDSPGELPGSPDSGPPPDSTPSPDFVNPLANSYTLTIQGSPSVNLLQKQQATLKVRYSKGEESVVGKPITFVLKGDARDATLSTFSAITDSLGIAQTTLIAGDLLGSFQIEARAHQANPVAWDATVSQLPVPPIPDDQLAGTFTLTSNFDIQTDFQGTQLASALNLLNKISDDPDDPGKYVVDLIFDKLDPQVQQVANIFRPILYPEVNKLLFSIAPDLIAGIKQLAQDLSALARKFQITSTMVSATPQPGKSLITVSHRLEAIAWTLKGKKTEYPFAKLGKNPEVGAVNLALANNVDLSIGEHTFDLKFGAFLLVGLNELVIPAIDPGASSFAGLFAGWVDCSKVGAKIYGTVGMFGEPFWKAACDASLKALGGVVEGQILKIDQDTSNLIVAGTCKLTDQDGDHYFDQMSSGLWTGSFMLQKSIAPVVGAGNSFSGVRTK